MQLFYTPGLNSNEYTLDEQESKHCIKVLRMHNGDELNLIDGIGNLYTAAIINDNYKACKLRIIDIKKEFEKRDYWLHIAIAPTKNIERFEWFLEKATEIGIDEITPIISEKSERKQVNNERLERIIISAMKQSIKAYKPKLNEAISFKNFISVKDNSKSKFIAHCIDSEKQELKNIYKKTGNAIVLIGPEGDFSQNEVNTAVNNAYSPVSLGNSRLRTETAGVVACHTINLLND
jgi:16S rRNA (uracil1498-N3)-methyltransferase